MPDLSLPLLRDTPTETDHSKSDWASWLAHVGAPPLQITAGPRFNQADLVIEAAVPGLGVALARTSLLADDIATGRLVFAFPRAAPTAFSYFVRPPQIGLVSAGCEFLRLAEDRSEWRYRT
jgi:LysR family glycine cleavage system transcriptional activator